MNTREECERITIQKVLHETKMHIYRGRPSHLDTFDRPAPYVRSIRTKVSLDVDKWNVESVAHHSIEYAIWIIGLLHFLCGSKHSLPVYSQSTDCQRIKKALERIYISHLSIKMKYHAHSKKLRVTLYFLSLNALKSISAA